MRRRRLLAALAGTAVGTAGCVASSGAPAQTPTSDPAQTPTDEPSLRIVGESFTAGDGSCANGEGTADVTFETDAVRVDGRLATPTPCHGAALAETSLDGTTLVVAVRTTDPTAEACAQCVGAVPYDLTVRVDGGRPETVRVDHDGETVATVRR